MTTELKTRIEKMERELAEMKAKLAVEKWEPEGGENWIDASGCVIDGDPVSDYAAFGMERKTRELAEKAAKQMRTHNRILAYVHQYAPDWEADWSDDRQHKYLVCTCHKSGLALVLSNLLSQNQSMVYMPKHVAEQLAADINSGRFDLGG